MLFSIDCVNVYLFSIYFSVDFARWGCRTLCTSWFFNFKETIKKESCVFGMEFCLNNASEESKLKNMQNYLSRDYL